MIHCQYKDRQQSWLAHVHISCMCVTQPCPPQVCCGIEPGEHGQHTETGVVKGTVPSRGCGDRRARECAHAEVFTILALKCLPYHISFVIIQFSNQSHAIKIYFCSINWAYPQLIVTSWLHIKITHAMTMQWSSIHT